LQEWTADGPIGTATNDVFVLFRLTGGGALPDSLTNATITVLGSGRWNTTNAHVYLEGNELLLTGVWLVPEPSTMLLWLAGGAVLYAKRRRWANSQNRDGTAIRGDSG
jgi:hypothetical protein